MKIAVNVLRKRLLTVRELLYTGDYVTNCRSTSSLQWSDPRTSYPQPSGLPVPLTGGLRPGTSGACAVGGRTGPYRGGRVAPTGRRLVAVVPVRAPALRGHRCPDGTHPSCIQQSCISPGWIHQSRIHQNCTYPSCAHAARIQARVHLGCSDPVRAHLRSSDRARAHVARIRLGRSHLPSSPPDCTHLAGSSPAGSHAASSPPGCIHAGRTALGPGNIHPSPPPPPHHPLDRARHAVDRERADREPRASPAHGPDPALGAIARPGRTGPRRPLRSPSEERRRCCTARPDPVLPAVTRTGRTASDDSDAGQTAR